jgi:pimeloyl-ACP methyl ester carboxylesterase
MENCRRCVVLDIQAGSSPMIVIFFLLAFFVLPIVTPALGNDSRSSGVDFLYSPKYIEVRGARMHYVESGIGNPILLLHGNPTSVYIWRNIIPLLAKHGRVIAVDLIGFGKSDKPAIDYRFSDHAAYLEGFIKKMGLRNITLVMHDWGSALGFDYASKHADNIRALVFFEALSYRFPVSIMAEPNRGQSISPLQNPAGRLGSYCQRKQFRRETAAGGNHSPSFRRRAEALSRALLGPRSA